MLSSKAKTIFAICFCIVLAYTFYGISQLGKEGGPCNGGLTIIIFVPLVILSTVVQLIVFVKKSVSLDTKTKVPFMEVAIGSVLICLIVFLILFIYDFAKDDKIALVYLIPFLCTNFVTLFIMSKRKVVQKN
jgi:hypothetical protein